MFFYPTPYQYALLSGIAIPVIALIVAKLSNGLIKVDEKKGSAYPSVVYAFIFPSLGLMARAFFDYNIFEYRLLWMIVVMVVLIFIGLLFIGQREFTFKKKADYVTVLTVTLFLFCYGFGAAIHVNCYYDQSQPENFRAKILNKRISSGKTTTYYLELSPWGKQKEIDEVAVDEDLYNRTETGNEVNVYSQKRQTRNSMVYCNGLI